MRINRQVERSRFCICINEHCYAEEGSDKAGWKDTLQQRIPSGHLRPFKSLLAYPTLINRNLLVTWRADCRQQSLAKIPPRVLTSCMRIQYQRTLFCRASTGRCLSTPRVFAEGISKRKGSAHIRIYGETSAAAGPCNNVTRPGGDEETGGLLHAKGCKCQGVSKAWFPRRLGEYSEFRASRTNHPCVC